MPSRAVKKAGIAPSTMNPGTTKVSMKPPAAPGGEHPDEGAEQEGEDERDPDEAIE